VRTGTRPPAAATSRSFESPQCVQSISPILVAQHDAHHFVFVAIGLLLLIDGSGERRPEPRHGRVSRGVTPDDFGTLETWCIRRIRKKKPWTFY
jgi:hypothetical protein